MLFSLNNIYLFIPGLMKQLLIFKGGNQWSQFKERIGPRCEYFNWVFRLIKCSLMTWVLTVLNGIKMITLFPCQKLISFSYHLKKKPQIVSSGTHFFFLTEDHLVELYCTWVFANFAVGCSMSLLMWWVFSHSDNILCVEA